MNFLTTESITKWSTFQPIVPSLLSMKIAHNLLHRKLQWYIRMVVVRYSLKSQSTLTPSGICIFHHPATLTEQFPDRMREGEERQFMETELTQQQPEPATTKSTSAIAVSSFGNHVERNHSNSNQIFVNEFEVICCMTFVQDCYMMVYLFTVTEWCWQ